MAKKHDLIFLDQKALSDFDIPFEGRVATGFPSPARDYKSDSNLIEKLLKNRHSSFVLEVGGDSMIDANLEKGDYLIVDKIIDYDNIDGKMFVCYIEGEYTCKFVIVEKDKVRLIPANKKYKEIVVEEGSDLRLWAEVIYILKKPLRYGK